MKTMISIVIPTYNGEKHLYKLLKKIRDLQKYWKLEVIVIDSSSTDKTRDIIESFRDKIYNLRLEKIPKESFNHAKTRNFAVKLATGKYVCFFSQDAIPGNSKFLQYFIQDLEINEKVVAVYGKHIPYKETPYIPKLEILYRFKMLDNYTNKSGLLIQDLDNPFIPYTDNNKLLWYFLSDTFSCYKKSFLIRNPFPQTNYGEDFLLGKIIINKGFIKIYDKKCIVNHSHVFNIFEYIKRETEDLTMRSSLMGLSNKINFKYKLKNILTAKDSVLVKLLHVCQLFFYYIIKSFIFLYVKIGT